MNRNKFTLVELLVVVGLISLLLGLVAPAFSRMMSGNKVADAASNLKLGLEQAQSYAVSRRSYVALILPNKSTANVSESADDYDSDEQSALLGGFRLAEVSVDKSNNEVTFKQWIEDFPWKSRGEGAVLVYGSNVVPTTKEDGTVLTQSIETNKKTEDFDALNLMDVKDVTFPDPQNDGKAIQKDRSKCAIIFSPYGGCYGGTTHYFVVTEGTINGEYIELAGEKTEKTNFLILKVNGYTGRVEYYDETDND